MAEFCLDLLRQCQHSTREKNGSPNAVVDSVGVVVVSVVETVVRLRSRDAAPKPPQRSMHRFLDVVATLRALLLQGQDKRNARDLQTGPGSLVHLVENYLHILASAASRHVAVLE